MTDPKQQVTNPNQLQADLAAALRHPDTAEFLAKLDKAGAGARKSTMVINEEADNATR